MSSLGRAAVIGVGYLGQFHAQKYKNNSRVQLVGVCDPRPEQGKKVGDSLQVKSFTSAQDLIGQVDMVTIAATTSAHYELAKLFLKNGVHVNVEKPIAATLPQAEELVSLARQKKLKLAVGHIERFNPSILELRKHLNKPISIQLTRWAPFKLRGADVSVLHDLMIHDIDLMFWLAAGNTGEKMEVKNWLATGAKILTEALDTAQATFELSHGVIVHINVNRMAAQTIRQIQVVQKDAILSVQTGTLQIEKVEPISAQSEAPLRVNTWMVEKADALQGETDDFIDAVLSDRRPTVTGEDGLQALLWVETLQKRILEKS